MEFNPNLGHSRPSGYKTARRILVHFLPEKVSADLCQPQGKF